MHWRQNCKDFQASGGIRTSVKTVSVYGEDEDFSKESDIHTEDIYEFMSDTECGLITAYFSSDEKEDSEDEEITLSWDEIIAKEKADIAAWLLTQPPSVVNSPPKKRKQ